MIYDRRPDDMIRITTAEQAEAYIEEQIAAMRQQIGDKKVLLAFKIRKIVDIIEDIDKLQIEDGQGYIPEDFWYIEKDYI